MKYGPLLLGERIAHHIQHRFRHPALIADVQVRMPAQGVMRQRRLEDVPTASRAEHLLACVLSCFQIKQPTGYLIPRPIRDFLYRCVALNRYPLFGQTNACLLPSAENKRHFLEHALGDA